MNAQAPAPDRLPARLTLAAPTPAALLARLERGEHDPHPGQDKARLCIIEPDAKKLALARKAIAAGKPWRGRQQIYFSAQGLASEGGKLTLLFPGLDSAFEPRAEDLAAHFGIPLPAACATFDVGRQLAQVVSGVLAFNDFLTRILDRLDLRADALAGHSLGELSALRAAGVLPASLDLTQHFLDVDAAAFPREILFLMAGAAHDRVAEAVQGLQGLYMTHDNCPHQSIAGGPRAQLELLRDRLREQGILSHFLPFAGGFHTPYLEAAQRAGHARRAALPLADPRLPLWSSASATPFPASQAQRQALLDNFLLRPVRFRELIEGLYADGQRIFLQVGTGSLTGFVSDTLGERPHAVTSMNLPARSGLAQLMNVCALLWVEGVRFDTRLLAAAIAPEKTVPTSAGSPSESEPSSSEGASTDAEPSSNEAPLLRASAPRSYAVHPVEAAVLETLADIDAARAEVLSLLRRRPPERRSRHAASSLSDGGLRPGMERRIQRLLDLASTIPFVADHALHPQRPGWPEPADGHPVVPMTMEIQMVRAAAEEAFPGYKVIELRNAQAYRWLGVAQPLEVSIVLRTADAGVVNVEIEGYFRAQLQLLAAYPEPPPGGFPPVEDPRPAAVGAEQLYRGGWMFHGPAYQGITRLYGRGTNGLDADLRAPPGEGALLDNMGQVAGCWVMEEPEGCLAIPIGVDRLRFFADEPGVGTDLRCEMRVLELEPLTCVSRLRLCDGAGRTLVLADGWRTRRYQVDQTFRDRSRLAQGTSLSEAWPDGVALFEDRYDTAMVREYISRRYLTMAELAQYEGLAPRRRRQWLNGRCAAKDAVRQYLHARGAERIFPKELEIINEASGQPRIRPNVTDNVPASLAISLTHKDKLAAAMVSEQAVGIDLERIEARGEAFAAMVISPAERALLGTEAPDLALTRAWVAKEAAAKARGSGLGGNARAWVINARSGDALCVNGQWVQTKRLGNAYIIGWTIMEPLQQAAAVSSKQTADKQDW